MVDKLKMHLGAPLRVNGGQNNNGCAQDPVSESFSHHLFKSLRGAQVPVAHPSRRETSSLMVLVTGAVDSESSHNTKTATPRSLKISLGSDITCCFF